MGRWGGFEAYGNQAHHCIMCLAVHFHVCDITAMTQHTKVDVRVLRFTILAKQHRLAEGVYGEAVM